MRDGIKALTEYLGATEGMMALASGRPVDGAEFFTLHGYVLKKGREYASEALTDSEMKWLFELIDRYGARFPKQQCFSNAQRLLLHAEAHKGNALGMDLRYVEGFVLGIIPVMHGWLTLNNKVIDLTLRVPKEEWLSRKSTIHRGRLRDRVLGQFSAPRAYYGVEMPTRLIRERMARTGCWGTLLDEWESGWPLLRNIGTQGADEGPHDGDEANEGHEPSAGGSAEDGGPEGPEEGAGGLPQDEGGRAGSGEAAGDSAPDPGALEGAGEGPG